MLLQPLQGPVLLLPRMQRRMKPKLGSQPLHLGRACPSPPALTTIVSVDRLDAKGVRR